MTGGEVKTLIVATPALDDAMEHAGIKCAFIVLYLGKLPPYFSFWAKSCEYNHRQCHWYLYNDTFMEVVRYNPAVTIVPYTFEKLAKDIARMYCVAPDACHPRLVCDYELLVYSIRKADEQFAGVDFVGFTDLDVIYGDIASFLPCDPCRYAMISAHNGRPCGPFTLFNKRYLDAICMDERIKTKILNGFSTLASDQQERRYAPLTGSSGMDASVQGLQFEHLDESTELMSIAAEFAPVYCAADPLQPTMTRGFNRRKAFALWEKGRLRAYDNRMHVRHGAIFHFSRFKKRARFKLHDAVVATKKWGIYKYGIIEMKTLADLGRMYFSLLV